MPVSIRLLVAASVALLAGAWNGYASAGITCTYHASTKLVRVQLTSQIEVFVQRDGAAIVAHEGFTDYPCGPATISNTNKIVVAGTGATGDKTYVHVSESAGRLAPGARQEARGKSEIEVKVDVVVDAAFGLELDYGGTPHRDVAKLGVKGIDLNGDGDVDITPAGPVRIYGLDGTGGNDLLSGAGSKATGGAVERPVSMFGGAGDDRLVGGRGNDFINEDFAETGDDVLIGGRGNDSLNGGGGKDTLHAGRGKDSLVADDGRRDLVDGGRGIDSFQYDHGLDVVRNKP